MHYEKYGDAYRERAKVRRARAKHEYHINMLKYLSDKCCVICGESDVVVLEMDHIDPRTKLFSISQAVKLGYSWETILKELEKCRVLCANCHKRHTAKQFGWYKA
jgi:5-methylcytosine-specific restriction endonuclease McrA